jgi:Tfp pilus assembly protein PilX
MTKREDEVMPKQLLEDRRAAGDSGFALILAILALLLLTFLGLTMAVTTSTELQIAQNYRWSQQALYNAEAGVEVGKSVLRGVNWTAVLPNARTVAGGSTSWDGVTAPTVKGGGTAAPFTRNDAWGNPSRNFENWQCDARGNGVGYGVVLDDGSASAPYQYVTTYSGQNLNGAVTIWVRRLPRPRPEDGTFEDYTDTDDSSLVLVAEGVAPYAGGSATTSFARNRQATQVIEVALSRGQTTTNGGCGNRSGQAGGSQLGANFGGCGGITGGTGITKGMVGGTSSSGGALGTGTELNPNQ